MLSNLICLLAVDTFENTEMQVYSSILNAGFYASKMVVITNDFFTIKMTSSNHQEAPAAVVGETWAVVSWGLLLSIPHSISEYSLGSSYLIIGSMGLVYLHKFPQKESIIHVFKHIFKHAIPMDHAGTAWSIRISINQPNDFIWFLEKSQPNGSVLWKRWPQGSLKGRRIFVTFGSTPHPGCNRGKWRFSSGFPQEKSKGIPWEKCNHLRRYPSSHNHGSVKDACISTGTVVAI